MAAACSRGQEADLEPPTPTGRGLGRIVLMESGLELASQSALRRQFQSPQVAWLD